MRLLPFTANFPKPLMPLGDIPIVEVLVRRLIAFGLTDVTLTLGHLGALIKAYFHHRQELTRQLTLHFVEEDEPTGTAGSLAFVPGLDKTFLVMNSDLLTDIDFNKLVLFHRQSGAALTIATHERRVKIDLGVLEFDKDHRVVKYVEKPEMDYRVSMGIYVYEPYVLQYIEPGAYLDFPDLVLRLLAGKIPVSAYPSDGLWLDIGRPEDYAQAQDLFSTKKEALLG